MCKRSNLNRMLLQIRPENVNLFIHVTLNMCKPYGIAYINYKQVLNYV